ncbi:MAG: DUF484 family protein [Porticoccaceae bacterium]
MSDNSENSTSEINLAQVRAYLIEHPDFFNENFDLLERLALPHQSGGAISLVERQVGVLRERNQEMRGSLNELMTIAGENDRLFTKTRRLTLELLSATSLANLIEKLYDSLGMDFRLEFYSLTFVDDAASSEGTLANHIAREQLHGQVARAVDSGQPVIGPLRADEMGLLFGASGEQVGSAAVLAIGRDKPRAILAVGDSDINYYQSDMGTLFIAHIGDMLERLLPELTGSD